MTAAPPRTPKVDVLEALLSVYTLEQLQFIAERSHEALERTGFGHVVLCFSHGRFETLEQMNSYKAPEKRAAGG